MMIKSLFVSFALAWSAQANKRAFVPSRTKAVLTLRGGAGPLDSDLVAKFATGSLFANSVPEILAPSKVCELYGVGSDDLNNLLIEKIGADQLSFAILVYKVLFQGSGLNAAVGAALIPQLVAIAKSLLNDDSGKVGVPATGEYLNLAINAVVAHACFTKASHADTAVKIFSYWVLANGIFLGLAPQTASAAWGNKNLSGTDKLHLIKVLGASISAIAVFMVSITQGVDSLQALGYALVPFFLLIFSALFVTKEVETINMTKGGHYFWLISFAIEVLTLAIPAAKEATPVA